jgi:hypothetical protein
VFYIISVITARDDSPFQTGYRHQPHHFPALTGRSFITFARSDSLLVVCGRVCSAECNSNDDGFHISETRRSKMDMMIKNVWCVEIARRIKASQPS